VKADYRTLAIIVTYSNRIHLLEKVINSCFANGIDKVLVIDNNSSNFSRFKLKDLSIKNEKVKVIWNSENKGSAAAFKQGLIYAKANHKGLILLLDDDNMLENGVLKKLITKWASKDLKTKCLLAFRPDRDLYKKAIQLNDPEFVLSPENSFYGFSIWDKLKRYFTKSSDKVSIDNEGFIAYAPYGGMFFHSSLIEEIGYPREDFYLYSDDHDWSYRIYKLGYKIKLITECRIKDIDESWAINSRNIFETMRSANPIRIYYTIRNRLVFEIEERITKQYLHQLNLITFKLFLYLYCGDNKQYKIFKLAVKDGFNKNLGKKTDDYFNV
jgi:GT2 family glycosyltransferase